MKPKALYNLLKMDRDPSLQVEAWKVADYRSLPVEDLFQLANLDEGRLLAVAEECSTPEELTGFFVLADAEPEEEDRLYLVLFELWRRLLPERQALSIFCDELDHRITAYDCGEADEVIQDSLTYLQELLDDEVDEGADPHELFVEVSTYFANDLEAFLYDYIVDEIENEGDASELIEGFSPYIQDESYFQLLQVRLWAKSDLEHAMYGLEAILEEEPNIELYFEILDFLVKDGDRDLFLDVAKRTLPLMNKEEEFVLLLDLCIDYYRCLDRDDKEAAIDRLITLRKQLAPATPFTSADPAVASLISILNGIQITNLQA